MSLILNSGFTIGPGVVLDANPIITPNPVSTGLQLHLDAGNPNSYPGSGTTWTDLVASKEFTLFGGAAYNSANGGHINFIPASNQYAEATSLPNTLSNWTVEAWHYYTGTNSSGSPCIVTEVYAGNPINFTLGNTNDSSPNLRTGFFDGHWGSTPDGTILITGHWYHLVGTWDGSTVKLYINGELVSSQADGGTANRGGAGIRLMCRWDVGQFWGGRLAVVRIYDTALDLAGVAQNFDADRARFGL